MSEAQGEDGQKKPKKPRGPRTPKLTKAQRDALDEQMPECLTWDPEDVAHWICSLGFPQYQVLVFSWLPIFSRAVANSIAL